MGNHTGKDSTGHTGSPLDFFHTPPTTPSEAELAAMALSSSAFTTQEQQQNPRSPETTRTASPSTTSVVSDWATGKPSVPAEWAVISIESKSPLETAGSQGRAKQLRRAAGNYETVSSSSPVSPPLSKGSPSDQSWQERDSGLEFQVGGERVGEEVSLVLLSLMEHYRASLCLSPCQDAATGAVELLRRLVSERDELVEEVCSLKDTLRMERAEWRQFQCDLQVAVSVADRLRTEAEQALAMLQESHRTAEEQLAQALSQQQEKDRELECLRAQHRDACRQLSPFLLERQQESAEPDSLSPKDKTDSERAVKGKDSVEGHDSKDGQREVSPFETQKGDFNLAEKGPQDDTDWETQSSEKPNESQEKNGVNGEVSIGAGRPESEDGLEQTQLTGKGVAETYLRSLAAKKKEEGCGPRDPRRVVMLSERSWSLSRLPLPNDSPTQNGTPQNTRTTLPLCKKEDSVKGRRMERVLQRQDSWSSTSTKRPDEDPNSDFVRPQDGFSALLRRHGGSRRNSLLRWCQNRTRGYKNIEITNFSSSWEDGLAFCAVFHTYLPAHIPYSSLDPAEKKENLARAFQTGESVGITATLTVEEMLSAGGPDWQRVLGYVESIFRHFEM